jgi:hypothetical protein
MTTLKTIGHKNSCFAVGADVDYMEISLPRSKIDTAMCI